MKLLCLLGWHRWDYCPLTIGFVSAVNRECLRCHLEQIYARGVKQWITVKPAT